MGKRYWNIYGSTLGLKLRIIKDAQFRASDPPREDFFALTRFVAYELILFVSHFARLQHKNALPL